MAKVSFSVSARTAKLIGQENFANAEGAIIELVKNAYDADAKDCVVIFDNVDLDPSKHKLYIIDNGTGMTSEIIQNAWMKIGTGNKLNDYESKGGRVKTGAKGIGRFALDRLGLSSTMYTLSNENNEGSLWRVQWSDFEKVGISIQDVKADLSTVSDLNIVKYLADIFEPYENIRKLLRNKEFDSGTILIISNLKDSWLAEDIKSLFDNLEVLIPPLEQPDFSIYLFSTSISNEYGEVNSAYYDDYDYKVKAVFLGDENHTLKIKITRNELDLFQLENSFSEVFENKLMSSAPYNLETFKKKTFEAEMSINDFPGFNNYVAEDNLKKIGKFQFVFYFLKRRYPNKKERKKYPYRRFESATRTSWLKKFGGIKIFRDDFRVRPYGENGQDWLGLGERESASPGGPGQRLGGYRISRNQIAGTVNISRIDNINFQDKSGREGIQENEVFDIFKNILIGIVSIFERDRNIIMFSLSELADKRNLDEQEKQKAKEAADRILAEEEKKQESILVEDTPKKGEGTESQSGDENNKTEVLLLAKANKAYEKEISDKDEEIRMLRGLASVGLIISSFAHELKGLRLRLMPRTDHLINELKHYIKPSQLKGIVKEDDPFYMIQLIKEEDIKLKHWLDYSLSTLKRDKRKRKHIPVGEYFDSFVNNWSKALKQRKIKILLKGSTKEEYKVRAFEVDLDTIFNNLLSNSFNAFKLRKEKYSRTVTIDWEVKEAFIEILFADNGAGLSAEYENDPYRIFEYNESSLRDRRGNQIGTGMGLYMVQLVIDDYNGASINIPKVREGFALQISLPLVIKSE